MASGPGAEHLPNECISGHEGFDTTDSIYVHLSIFVFPEVCGDQNPLKSVQYTHLLLVQDFLHKEYLECQLCFHEARTWLESLFLDEFFESEYYAQMETPS